MKHDYIGISGYGGDQPGRAMRIQVDERTDAHRITDLEAWAFRTDQVLAEIKASLREKPTVVVVDELHHDVVALRNAMNDGFKMIDARFDSVNGELATHRRLLEEILGRLPAKQ